MNDTELEVDLRATLQAHAATVVAGPGWHGAPAGSRKSRTRWVAAVAAAVTVTALAMTAVVLKRDGDQTAAAGTPTCATHIPAAWRHAVHGEQVTFHGRRVYADIQLPNGGLIGEVYGPDNNAIVVAIPRRGAPRPLYTGRTGDVVRRVDTDGRYVVISVSPPIMAAHAGPITITRIVAIDVNTGHRTLIATFSRKAPFVEGKGAVVQDGIVYWTSGPSLTEQMPGTVHSVDIRTGRRAVVGHVSGHPEIDHDVRGVVWPGGSVPAAATPADMPAAFGADDHYQPVFADHGTFAWQRLGSHTVTWVGRDGATKRFAIDTSANGGYDPVISSVNGRYLVYWLNDTGDGAFVLDTATGATAHLGGDAMMTFIASPTLALAHDTATVLIDTTTLPGLHC